MKRRVAILISGSGSNMVSLIEAMGAEHPGAPVLVLSNRPDARGIAKARALRVPAQVIDHTEFSDRESFEAALGDALEAAGAEVICLAGFMRVLTAGFVDRWAGRILNIHPSLLPKYKGLHTHARALEAGDAEHGVSVHLVTAGLDDGPVLGQARVPVLAGDTPQSLAARVLVEEHRLYPAVLEGFLADLA